MNIIPDKYRDLLDRPIVVSLATLMNEGPPQVQPVWCNFDGTHILVNTEKGRQKYRNMSRRPSVTILAIDPDKCTPLAGSARHSSRYNRGRRFRAHR
jgi:nitroimidazol reductase NimA-like FMN-containing flavoprotein (pyridoxamine 5'-phosphate oxidase superfamily)